ncbi:MAG: nucleoside 2-deoxyribosyltransferase [SAR324 cluster bacterium]|nr:nucleoside 2-deoxyribosyltransferase [SAR324 cluster bacterium]
MIKKLYLANAYGFSSQCSTLLHPVIKKLSDLGAEVWEPFSRCANLNLSSYAIGQKNLADLNHCDGVFAIVNGCPPDEGISFELGYAAALEKPVFLFRDDFRVVSDGDYPLNLMLFTGLPEGTWKNYYYTILEDLSDPDKALVQWLKNRLVQ